MARKTRKTISPAAVLAAGINGHADRLDAATATDAATPTAEPLPDVFPDEAPELDPAADFDPDDLFPPDRVDPWDCQADPTLWPAECDSDRWELGPAADHDEPTATLSLVDLVAKQAERYRAWPLEAGRLIAEALDELAGKIQATGAQTPDEYRARLEILEAEAVEQHETVGYQAGLDAGREECRRKHGRTPSSGGCGHPAEQA
jgi:hypothetical protein